MKLSAEQIEAAVDADGAWNLLLALEIVLGEKAEHLRTNWQDHRRAREYDSFSQQCGKLARKLEKADI